MNYARVQQLVDRGLGKAALRLGQPFSVFRVTDASTGDFPNDWTLLGENIPVYRERVSEPKLEVGIAKATLFYNVFGDMSPYNLGDVFLCTDPPFDPGVSYGENATILPDTLEINALSLAWHMPARIPTGARLSHQVRIYRPATGPKTLADGSKYWVSTHDNDQPLRLTGGEFAFGAPGATAAAIIGGMVTTDDTVGLTLTNASVPAFPHTVTHTVVIGDTPTTIATALAALIVADAIFRAANVTVASLGPVVTVSQGGIVAPATVLSAALSMGASETVTLTPANGRLSSLGSIVPAGFVAAYRPSGPYPFGPPVPGMIRPTHWYVYLPPLPGYESREGDAICTIDDARYVVVDPYRQESGLVGQQMLVDRTTAQAQ